jgi:DNA-binding response OmpR family regulator
MKPASILVTDDESSIRLMLRTALESEGYAVAEAADGQEALQAINRRVPDLVVLDLNMPKVDGMAVLEQLKALAGAGPRVIVLTAYGSIPAAVKATHLGALDFLEKPVTPNQLRSAVRSVLDEPQLDSPPAAVDATGCYDSVLDHVRKSLRLAEYATAETLLTKAAARNARTSAGYFNLLGVLYESQRKWRLARKCYGKAMTADKEYEPAKVNMRRIYELFTFGHSKEAVMLGDEDKDLWVFRMPESHN